MKSMTLVLAISTLAISVVGCSHKPTRATDEPPRAAAIATPPAAQPAPVLPGDEGTVSGTTTSLGAATSGRGH